MAKSEALRQRETRARNKARHADMGMAPVTIKLSENEREKLDYCCANADSTDIPHSHTEWIAGLIAREYKEMINRDMSQS